VLAVSCSDEGNEEGRPKRPDDHDSAEEDELEKLLQQYEREAEADKAKVQAAQREKPASQMSMAGLRESGLAKPLSEDTKCAALLLLRLSGEERGIHTYLGFVRQILTS
jgi:hypothetical protein